MLAFYVGEIVGCCVQLCSSLSLQLFHLQKQLQRERFACISMYSNMHTLRIMWMVDTNLHKTMNGGLLTGTYSGRTWDNMLGGLGWARPNKSLQCLALGISNTDP